MTPDQVVQWKDKIITLCVEKGPKLMTAIVILVLGGMVARFVGRIAQGWLNKRDLEPPVRILLTRVAKLIIIAMFAVVALGTAGIDTAPLVAGIGVAGVGIGLAMQGVPRQSHLRHPHHLHQTVPRRGIHRDHRSLWPGPGHRPLRHHPRAPRPVESHRPESQNCR